MNFSRKILGNVVSAVVASLILATAVFAWDLMKNGALISAFHGVTKKDLDDRLSALDAVTKTELDSRLSALDAVTQTDLDDRLGQIGKLGLAVANERMTLQCTWEPVGREKSHHMDQGDWCPEGHLLRQLDIDGLGGEHVGNAMCCKLIFE